MRIGIFPDSQAQAQETRGHIHADRRRVAKAKDVDAPGFQEQPGRRIKSVIIEETQRILQSLGNIGKDLGRYVPPGIAGLDVVESLLRRCRQFRSQHELQLFQAAASQFLAKPGNGDFRTLRMDGQVRNGLLHDLARMIDDIIGNTAL